ncbi:HPP family protein [Actinomadura viridis]|uniref:CBS domain-containing protein n=1 Tax=Actinomadura viridis TaxID=58110 RepID=UPI0036B9DFB5
MTPQAPLERRTVAELMTADLLTIAAGESVLMAWELMCKAGVHHLPVVDDEGGFLGIVDAQTLTALWDSGGPRRARRPVTDLLAERDMTAVRPGDPVPAAARSMLESGTDYVAVTNDDGALVGLVTAYDIIGELAGVPLDKGEQRSGMPSLYRIEPVLPGPPPGPGERARDGRPR